MKIEAVKEKLHDYIEHGDESKIRAIYLLLNEELDADSFVYDEATLNMLEARKEEMASGKVKTYTLEQTIEHLREYCNQ